MLGRDHRGVVVGRGRRGSAVSEGRAANAIVAAGPAPGEAYSVQRDGGLLVDVVGIGSRYERVVVAKWSWCSTLEMFNRVDWWPGIEAH